jgi:hypothetical protein
VRALSPDLVLIVDASEMQLAPGEVRLLDEDCVAAHFQVTTHPIPLNFLIASLKETVPDIVFLGIQPRDTVFCNPLSPNVRSAVDCPGHHGWDRRFTPTVNLSVGYRIARQDPDDGADPMCIDPGQ